MPFFLGSKFQGKKNTTTLQFTKNNMLHSFIMQMFIDLVVLVSNFFLIMKNGNKLGRKKKEKKYKMQERKNG